jgi:hypothetical protein
MVEFVTNLLKGKIMALLKTEQTNWGVDVTYWNIHSISEDYKGKTLVVLLAGYISKETRDTNSDAVSTKTIILSGEDYISEATRKKVYIAIKTTEDFLEAEDC